MIWQSGDERKGNAEKSQAAYLAAADSGGGSEARIEDFGQTLAEQVHGQHQAGDRDAWERGDPPRR